MFFTIPNFFERMLEEPFSPLTVLSISAIITTISLFFCGIPICLQIFRRGSTHEISGFPFLMGFLGGVFWLRYGFMKKDLTMVTVNCVGVSLMSLYLLFYLYFSRPRTRFLAQLTFIGLIVSAMLTLVHIYQMDVLNPLGFVCMTFNIMNFGAPLAGLTVVLRNRSCATLPLPLCVANLLVSSQWCVYGVCVNDIFITIPNGAGVILAMLQINLFMIFPRKSGSKAPLARCCQCVEDLELADERLRLNHHPHHRPPRTIANKFMHRQRVIDRRLIPTSRAACIAFLRANGFDASGGSVTSRSTADSWMSNSLSRISSHYSHPELWTPSAGVVERADGDGAETLYTVDSAVHLPQTLSSDGPSTSLLSSPMQRTSAADPSIYEFDRSRELEDHWMKGQWRNDEREQIIRTLSAPDLAQQQQMLKWEQEQQQQQQEQQQRREKAQPKRRGGDNPP